jgi:medium-chain acyl-[acyl-carrier-protein] hydrolase
VIRSARTTSLFEFRSDRRAPVRCLCFPYAGGGAGAFASWGRQLCGRVDVIPARLPGRESRLGEPPYTSFQELQNDLVVAAVPLLDRRFVLFGHSLGGLVAYELALKLYLQTGLAPTHLFIAAVRPPHVPRPANARILAGDHRLDDVSFTKKLLSLGGLPPEFLQEPECLRMALTIARADFRIYESYSRSSPLPPRQLPCPLTAFGAVNDVCDIPEQALHEWSRYARHTRVRMMPGGHFFIHDQAAAITATILASIGSSPAPPSAEGGS